MDTQIISADERLAHELPRVTNALIELADKSKNIAEPLDTARNLWFLLQLKHIHERLTADAAVMQNVMVVLLRQTLPWSNVRIRFSNRKFVNWNTLDGISAVETMRVRDRDLLQALCSMLSTDTVRFRRTLKDHRKTYTETVLTKRFTTSPPEVFRGLETIHKDVSAISQFVTTIYQAGGPWRAWGLTPNSDLPQALDLDLPQALHLKLPQALDLEVRRDSGIPGIETVSASALGLTRRSSVSSESGRTETYEEEGKLSYMKLSILSVDGLVLKEQQTVLLDGGATDAAMSGQLATELQLRTQKLPVPQQIRTSSQGDFIPVTDQVLIKVLWKEKDGRTKRVNMLFYVVWSLDDEMHLSDGFIDQYRLKDLAEKVDPGTIQFKKRWFSWSSRKQRQALDLAWEEQAMKNLTRNTAEAQKFDLDLAQALATSLSLKSTRP